jgi:hypothetical protein
LIYCEPVDRAGLAGLTEALFTESGELVAGTALTDPLASRTVRVHGGVPTVRDGPYDAVRAQLAGYVVVDCEHRDRAGEIAARFPSARSGAVEVRPIMDMSGQEM